MKRSGYALQGLHKNLLRLGSLAVCVNGASDSRGSTARDLDSKYRSAFTKRVPVDPSNIDRVIAYINERVLIRKYAPASTNTLEGVRGIFESGTGTVELQDWMLSDPHLKSSSGSEREQTYLQTVAACQEIGLLRAKTYTKLDPGKLLVRVATDTELLSREDKHLNPFRPNIPYSIMAYLQILTADYVLQQALFNALTVSPMSFTTELCSKAESILVSAQNNIPKTNGTRELHAWFDKQKALAVRLDEHKKTNQGWNQTFYRPMEDLLLPRLEFLVDLGVVTKQTRAKNIYQRNDPKGDFARLLSRGFEGLSRGYFTTMAEVTGSCPITIGSDDADFDSHIQHAYDRMKNLAGYAPIVDSVAYANANAHAYGNSEWTVVEVEDFISRITERSRENPPRARMVNDRFHRPSGFKLIN